MRISPLSLRLSAAVLALPALAAPGAAQQLQTTLVASGLTSPVYVTAPPADANRLFVVEQGGRIKIVENGQVLPTVFLDIDAKVQSGGEQGLLGLAFHPNYADNGRFYVSYTGNGGPSIVEEYLVSADPNVADPSTANIVYGPLPQPQANHNGGCIQFGPDGRLYLGLGDGGGANDQGTGHAPGGNAQFLGTDLGKLLRLDVDAPAPHVPADNPFADPNDGINDLIWAYGLRNPWRFSFDKLTRDLYLADVGQGAWEEVNFQPGDSAGGENYGWRCMEGAHCTGLAGCTCFDPGLVLPIHEYSHSFGCSITGGYVYRGGQVPDLQGQYFFADYCSARIWTLRYVNGQVLDLTERTGELDPAGVLSIGSIASFGEDALGELYIVDQGGEIFRIEPACPAPANYCASTPTSAGAGAELGWRGTNALSSQTFQLVARGIPDGASTLFLAGSGQAQTPLSNGFLCIAPPLQRLGTAIADDLGLAALPLDLNLVNGATPGATIDFQAYFRDPAAGAGNANLTNALEALVCP